MSLCRLCTAAVPGLRSIFSRKQDKTIAEMVKDVTSIEVQNDDPYSVLVCPDCIDATLAAFDFIKLVQEVEQQFRDKLVQVEEETINLIDIKQEAEMIDFTIFDADGVELMDHSASTIPNRNLLSLGDASVEIVELEPEETSKELLRLFVDSIHHVGSDKWNKLKCDRDFAELLTGSAELCEEDEQSDDDDESNPAKDVNSVARCCDRKCRAEFKTRAELLTHGIRVHRDESNTSKPFKCFVCMRQFDTRRALVSHMRQLIRDYRCRTCDVYFNTRIEREAHRKSSHGFKTSQRYKIEEQPIKICCGCDAKFETLEELYQHGIDVHKGKAALAHTNRLSHDFSQQCNICYKLFKNKAGVRYHQIAVYREKRFICGICTKPFETSSKLKNHKKVHITERKFVCEICGGKFKSSSELRLHSKSHEEPSLMCAICGARFRTGYHLRTHLKVHDDGPSEFSCHICQKQFKHKFSLKEHLAIHTGERVLKYACPHCSKQFPRNRDLKTHLRRVCEKVAK